MKSSTSAELGWAPSLHAILGPHPGLQLYGEVSIWFHKIELFRREENKRVFKGSPKAQDLEIHKRLVQRLIADGEHLSRVIDQTRGLVTNPENIKAEDVAAALEGLRDTYRGWHEPMPEARREKILKEAFKDVAERSKRSMRLATIWRRARRGKPRRRGLAWRNLRLKRWRGPDRKLARAN